MNDRFTSGFVAGVVGGFIAYLNNFIFIHFFKFGSLRYSDFSSILIFGHRSASIEEGLLSSLAFLGFSGSLGVIFSYLIPRISERFYWYKALIYGFGIWFCIYAVTSLFKVPSLTDISFPSALTNSISSALYGLITAWAFRRLTKAETLST